MRDTSSRRAAVLVAFALLTVACGSDPSSPPGNLTVSPTTSEEPTALIGTWERETHCEELVSALTAAGLDRWVLEFVAGNGFISGVTNSAQIADPANPCDGAVPRMHSHFFDEDGLFGSLDWNGDQVDDGTYEIIDDHTVVVSKEFPDVTFGYFIDGDTITFEPVIPDCASDCFEAAWSVSVAYPGETWQRVG